MRSIFYRTLNPIFLAWIISLGLRSESCSAQHSKRLNLSPKDTLCLEENGIIWESLKVYSDSSGTQKLRWRKIPYKNAILLLDTLAANKEITLDYQQNPFDYYRKISHKQTDIIQLSESPFPKTFSWNPGTSKTENQTWGNINKSGSITRGISFGNNQDLVANSNLNLQLSGSLSERIGIRAAVSDDNIPLQPDGNTRQLQEFDKVYIQVFDSARKLTAGDFQLKKPDSYFLSYYKRAQGAWYSSQQVRDIPTRRTTITQEVALAISRGKFSRMVFTGLEGNQGPYRLKGAENELFIIVLSGSERIYIDGELLTRGAENDYIIDYNTAELTFTAKRLITKDKRIIAEFQYSDRNYSRSMVVAGADIRSKEWTIHIHGFQEQDNKNRPLMYEMGEEQRKILESVGDSVDQAFFRQIDTVDFSENQILYRLTDTLVSGLLYEDILVYSTNPEEAIIKPSFSQVGQQRGNYRQINSTANGKVFEWVAPEDGLPQGDYEPVILLPAPKRKRMITGAAEYKKNGWRVKTELAATENCVNTLSERDRSNDQGGALKSEMEYETKIGRDSSQRKLITRFSHEWAGANFSPIERFRSVEFERDWNRPFSFTQRGNQHILNGTVGVSSGTGQYLQYQIGAFAEQGVYNGTLQSFSGMWKDAKWMLEGKGSYLSSNGTTDKSSFIRGRGQVIRYFGKNYQIGSLAEQEKNRIRFTQSDSLIGRSFAFGEYQTYAGTRDSNSTAIELRYIKRDDWLPSRNTLNLATTGETYRFTFSTQPGAEQIFRQAFSYRTLAIKDTLLTAQKADRSLLSRSEYQFRFLKGVISGQLFFELSSGQEIKKEYSFLEVATGQGGYAWNDYNKNGVKELNEFEIAVFSDQGRYIKVFTPTNEFVKTINHQVSQTLMIQAPSRWGKSKSLTKKFASRFSNQFSFRTDEKSLGADWVNKLNLFQKQVADSGLVSLNGAIRNTLFLNRNSQDFGMEFTYVENKNNVLLLNGLEFRKLISRTLRARQNLFKNWIIQAEASNGVKINSAEFLSTRNYYIESLELEPKIIYQPGVAFRAALSFRYSTKQNQQNDSLVTSRGQNIGIEIRQSISGKGSFTAKANRIYQLFNGNAGSAAGYEMLGGLSPGENYTWSLQYQRTLPNNMQITINYDGRKINEGKIIHTGGAQVRAFF